MYQNCLSVGATIGRPRASGERPYKTKSNFLMRSSLFDLVFFQRCLPLRASDVDFVSDVHCVSDVSPYGEAGKHHITLRRRSNTSLWRSHNITAATPQHHSQSSAPIPANALQPSRFYDILIPERRWYCEKEHYNTACFNYHV